MGHVVDPAILICAGCERPVVGQRLRAKGSQGNGLLVVEIIEPEQLPSTAPKGPQRFGLKLKYNEIPWPPDTPIEIVAQ